MVAFRRGDVVTIEATIASTTVNMGDGKGRVRIEFPPYCDAYVDPAQLALVRPAFVVGDMVSWDVPDQQFTGTVLSIANDHLWVDLGDGNFGTVWVGKAMRVDPDPPPVDPDAAPKEEAST